MGGGGGRSPPKTTKEKDEINSMFCVVAVVVGADGCFCVCSWLFDIVIVVVVAVVCFSVVR